MSCEEAPTITSHTSDAMRGSSAGLPSYPALASPDRYKYNASVFARDVLKDLETLREERYQT